MNHIVTILLLLAGFLLTENIFAQSVSNDMTFNPDDIGFDHGKGCDDVVRGSAVQPDGKIIIAGEFSSINGKQSPLARLHSDGRIDTTFNAPIFNNFYSIHDLKIQLDGKIIVAGQFSVNNNGSSQGNITRLNADGSLDSTFVMDYYIDDEIRTMAIQSDGKLIIGGLFEHIGSYNKSYIARLNANGTLDSTFIAEANWNVLTCAVQGDDKILVGGWFYLMNGTPFQGLARLNPDGSLDSSFQIGTGASGFVHKAMEMSDGKLLVSGSFLSFNGTNTPNIVRLLMDGVVDSTFHPENALITNSTYRISYFQAQPNGKIVIGGKFKLTSSTGNSNQWMARLEPDGSEDTIFASSEVSDEVYTSSLQSDGKLIIGGAFTEVGGIQKNYIARLNQNGFLDSTFNLGLGANGMVYGSVLQPDGKIILVGSFDRVNGHRRNGIVRLEANGLVDTDFSPVNMPGNLKIGLLQPDSKILVIGDSMYIVRLNADGTADPTFISPFANTGGSINTCFLYPDGKIFVAGNFYNAMTGNASSMARLLPNGDFDSAFVPGNGPNNTILTSVIQADGKIIIGGEFTEVNNSPRIRLARLLPDGALDPSYIVSINYGVKCCDLQPDGKLIIGGSFTIIDGLVRRTLARINQNGSLDTSFQAGINLFGQVSKIKALPDGKTLVCGSLSVNTYLQLHGLVRFQSNGVLDYTFNTGDGPNSPWTNTFEIQPDEKIIVAGDFTAFNGIGRNRVTRLEVCQSSLGPDTTVVECNSFTWDNGQTYLVSGNYLRILPNYLGCDSIQLLNLTLNHTNSTTNATACGSYTWTNGQTYSQTGSYSQTLVNAVGCDSIANLNLTILQKPNSVIQNNHDGTLTAMANFGQWIDCGTNLPIPGATDNLFVPTQNGSYAFVLTLNNGCSDTSDCISITDLGIDPYTAREFSINPNPTNDNVRINFSGPDAELTVYDTQGKIVLKDRIQNQAIISLQNLERGVYLFNFKNSDGHTVQRVVKH